MRWRRPLAIIGLAIIAVCYICTIIFALIDSPHAVNMLMASLFATIVIPVVMYAYMMVYKMSRKKLEEDAKEEEHP